MLYLFQHIHPDSSGQAAGCDETLFVRESLDEFDFTLCKGRYGAREGQTHHDDAGVATDNQDNNFGRLRESL